MYRWSFTNNTLTKGLYLAPATGEAYTSTLIGPDGAVYATNDARLFCCGAKANVSTGIIRRGLGWLNFDGSSREINPWLQGGVVIAGIFSALAFHFGIKSSSWRRRARATSCRREA